MRDVMVYTDGGCHGNPGPGGWAFVISNDSGRLTRSGADPRTTNNRMELQAVIEAFREVVSRGLNAGRVVVYTDSQYVRNGITSWIKAWLANGWRTSARKPVKNQDLWIALNELNQIVNPVWNWVKGHSGDDLNELCDVLVQKAIAGVEGGHAPP